MVEMSNIIKLVAHFVAAIAEAIAVVFIIIGIMGALIIYVRRGLLLKSEYLGITQSRNYLAHSLSLGLEFLIGADILRTAISPTWQDIGQLAAIVGIRTVLNFFLTRELKQIDNSKSKSTQ